MSEMPLSLRFSGSVPASSPACSAMSARASSGECAEEKNWLMVPRLMGMGNTTPWWFVYTLWT